MQNFKQQLDQRKKLKEQSQKEQLLQSLIKHSINMAENEPKKSKRPMVATMCTAMNGCYFKSSALQDQQFDIIKKAIKEQSKCKK